MALPGTPWHYRTEPSFPNSEATPVGCRIPGTACEAGGRRFEPGLVLQHSRAPSRWYAEGLFISGDGTLLGAAGVPSGVAEIEEAEVGLLFPQCLREDAQR